MTLRDPDVAEPVITTRAQLRSSLGAHSRDPLADQGYTCFGRSSSAVASQPAMAGFQPWLHQPCIDLDFVTRNRVPHRPLNKADLDLIYRNC